MAAKPVKRKRMSEAERRASIIQAAQEVFLENGFSGARTKAIAERAGITEPFLFRLFSSKSDMYAAAVVEPVVAGFTKLAEDIEALAATHDGDRAAFLRGLTELNLTFMYDYAGLNAVVLFTELGNGRICYKEMLAPILLRIQSVIAANISWQDPRIDPLVVRRALFGAQWAIGFDYYLRRETPDVPALSASLTNLFSAAVPQ